MTEFYSKINFRDDVPCRIKLERQIQNEVVDRFVHRHHERRKAERYAYSMLLECIPLDSSFQSVGECFSVQCRNLSTTGIGISHSTNLKVGAFFAMKLLTRGEGPLIVVGKVIWCQPRDYYQSTFDAGLEFQTRG